MQDSSRGLLPFYSHLITATPSVTPAFESQGTGPPVSQLLSSEGHGRGGGAGGEEGGMEESRPPTLCLFFLPPSRNVCSQFPPQP